MKLRHLEDAQIIWDEMLLKGFKLNDYTVSVGIMLFSKVRNPKRATEIFYMNKNESIFVNSCMIRMCEENKAFSLVI